MNQGRFIGVSDRPPYVETAFPAGGYHGLETFRPDEGEVGRDAVGGDRLPFHLADEVFSGRSRASMRTEGESGVSIRVPSITVSSIFLTGISSSRPVRQGFSSARWITEMQSRSVLSEGTAVRRRRAGGRYLEWTTISTESVFQGNRQWH